MTAPTPNAEMAYAVYDAAMANPNNLDMSQWSSGLVDLTDLTAQIDQGCGTTACYAGWTVALAGYKVHVSGAVYHSDGDLASADIEAFAARMLGIDFEQAAYLFYVNDDDLGEAVADIFGPRPDAAS